LIGISVLMAATYRTAGVKQLKPKEEMMWLTQ